MLNRRQLLAGGAAVAAAPLPLRWARGERPIVIGDLNSYAALPAFTRPYKRGWRLARAEINANGGVLGRPLEVVSRDDGGDPGQAVSTTQRLIQRDGAELLTGTILSNVGLAVSSTANRLGALFLAAEPLSDALVWRKGKPRTFRLRPGTYVQAAILAERAARMDATRWALVAPNYEYGQAAVAAFKELLRAKRPDVTFVAEQWPPLFDIDAASVVQAIDAAEPEAIFNVTFSTDLLTFVREGGAREVFTGRQVVSMLTGEPEWMAPLGGDVPEGWVVTGYPWDSLDTEAHARFRQRYTERFGESPRMGSVVGHTALHALARAIGGADATGAEAVAGAMRGLRLDSPFGGITFREVDQQSTMGTFLGRTAVRDGEGRLADWTYKDGAAYLPGPEAAAERRATGP